MTTIPVVYGIEINGTAEAAREMSKLADTTSDAFKKATREAGQFAGAVGSQVGGMVDDLTGLIGTIAGGGGGAIAGTVVAAIALASKAWQVYSENADKARKDGEAAADSVTKTIAAIRGMAEGSGKDNFAGKTYEQLKLAGDEQFKIVRGIDVEINARKEAVKELENQVALQSRQMLDGQMLGNKLSETSAKLVAASLEQKGLEKQRIVESRRQDAIDAAAGQRFVDEKNKLERDKTLELRKKLKERAKQDEEDMYKMRGDKADKAAAEAVAAFERRFAAQLEIEKNAWQTVEDQFGDRRTLADGYDVAGVVSDINWASDATREYNDVVAEGVLIQKNAAMNKENITAKEKAAILLSMDTIRAARDREALADRQDAITRAEDIGQIDNYMASAMRATDEQITKQRIENRQKETQVTITELHKQEDQQLKNLAIQRAMALATMEYGVAMTAVTPIINSFTSDLALLGEINRDNWRDMVMQGEELPKIIAKKAQAILAGIAQEAAGKSLMAAADATFQLAVGFGMLAVGNAAGANAAFAASALAAASSASYGALAGGAGAGAIGIGMARGDSAGSLVGLTSEEREERDRKRNGDKPRGGGGGSMGGSGNSRGRQDSGQTVFNITMEYGAFALAPEDPRRIARAFSSGERIARRDGFARLNG